MKNIALVLTALLSACATTSGISKAQLRQGMTAEQVDALGGQPSALKTDGAKMCRSYNTPLNGIQKYTHVNFEANLVVGWKSDQWVAQCTP